MQAAASLAPHSSYLDIAGGGHAPFLGHADQVAEQLRLFLTTAVGAT
jgi:pimeloyl-[acyl-carrier protein] methyl ester esterase